MALLQVALLLLWNPWVVSVAQAVVPRRLKNGKEMLKIGRRQSVSDCVIQLKKLIEMKKLIVNRKEDTVGRAVDWMSIRWIQVKKDAPLKFRFRRSLNELEAWKEVDLKRKAKGRPADLGRFSFTTAYSGPRTLNTNKVQDILSMLDFIPPIHHDFYHELLSGDVSTDSESEE